MINNRIRSFTVLLAAQGTSIFGTSLTGFSLGVWVFSQTNSVMIYFLIALANAIPIFVLSPIAGAVVDRVKRKKIFLAAQFAAFFITGVLMLLYFTGALRPWFIVGLVAINSIFLAFVFPAITATVPLMVPKDLLTRANGMISLVFGIIQIASPLIAGHIYETYGLKTIFIVDLITYSIAIVAVILTHIPQPKDQEAHSTEKEKFFQSIKTGWDYLNQNEALRYLIFYYAIIVSILTSMGILIQPMILSFADAQTLGFILTIAGCGILLGGLIVFMIKNLNRHMPVILTAACIASGICTILPITMSPMLLALGGFCIMTCFPIFDANNRALLQRKVDPYMLGRVFGLRSFTMGISKCLMLIAAGIMADYFFKPQMGEGGLLVPVFGALYGAGENRGIAVMISFLGVITFAIAMLAVTTNKIRKIDTMLADIESETDDSLEDTDSKPQADNSCNDKLAATS